MLFYRHRKLSIVVPLLVMLSLLITACAPAATSTPGPQPTAAPKPTEQPTAAPKPTEPPAQPTEAPKPTETSAPKPGEPLQSIGEGEGQVDIVSWIGYIERGETDPAYDWVTQFEKDTGCKVNNKVAATSDEMVALMNEGGFDLVTASGDASNRLISGGKLQAINIDLVPSWKTVDERLQNAPWHTINGVHYGVPYQWGPNILMYNKDVFKEPPTSWNVVFEEQTLPDGQSNKGRVQAYDGPIYIADAAMYLKAHKPELGITDPYELTRDQFNAALDLLRQQRTIIGRYWHDAAVQMEDFANEGVVASGSWPYQVNFIQGVPVGSVFPEEGVTGWADTTMMHIAAPHPNCSYKWLEWSLNPKLQGDLASWFGSVPAVPAACKGNELLTDEGCATNGFDNFEKIYFWKTPSGTCPDGKQECVPYYEWTTNFIAVIGGR
jgi:putative spermidine/putrescine transport system substrate-binding protein